MHCLQWSLHYSKAEDEMKNAKMSFNNSLKSFIMQLMANYQYTFDSRELLSQQPPEDTTKESQWLKITL